jgi:hypothetical protein
MLGRLQMIAPAIFIWSFCFYTRRKRHTARFSALFLGMVCHLLYAGDGPWRTINAQFELIVATAIGLGLAVDNVTAVPLARPIGLDRVRNWLVRLLVVRLLASTHFEPFQILASSSVSLCHRPAVTEAEIARVRALPDPVFCSIGTVCFRAGRSFACDDLLIGQRRLTAPGLRRSCGRQSNSMECASRLSIYKPRGTAVFPQCSVCSNDANSATASAGCSRIPMAANLYYSFATLTLGSTSSDSGTSFGGCHTYQHVR